MAGGPRSRSPALPAQDVLLGLTLSYSSAQQRCQGQQADLHTTEARRGSAGLLQAGYHVKMTGWIYGIDDSPSWDCFQRSDPSTLELLELLEDEPRGRFWRVPQDHSWR